MFCPTDDELVVVAIMHKCSFSIAFVFFLFTLFIMLKVKSPATKLYRNIQIGSMVFSQCLDLCLFLTEPLYLLPSFACTFDAELGVPLGVQAQLLKFYLLSSALVLETLFISLLYKLHAIGYSAKSPKLFWLNCVGLLIVPVFIQVFVFVICNDYEIVDTKSFLASADDLSDACTTYQHAIVLFPRVQDHDWLPIIYVICTAVTFSCVFTSHVSLLTLRYANVMKKTASVKTKEMLHYLQVVFMLQSTVLMLFFGIQTFLGALCWAGLVSIENIALSAMALILSFHSIINCTILLLSTKVYRDHIFDWFKKKTIR